MLCSWSPKDRRVVGGGGSGEGQMHRSIHGRWHKNRIGRPQSACHGSEGSVRGKAYTMGVNM